MERIGVHSYHAGPFIEAALASKCCDIRGIYSHLACADDPGNPATARQVVDEGDVNEAYVFADAYQAPAVFICVNNQWAISEPVELQSRVPLYQRAWGFGIPSVRVDGNDVLAMQSVTNWALARARAGQGPTFIEAYTYRMGAHTTSDDPTKYRESSQAEAWRRKDPLNRTQAWLRASGVWDDAQQARLDQEAEGFGAEVRAAVDRVQAPRLDEVFDRVYARPTADLTAQRAQALREAGR